MFTWCTGEHTDKIRRGAPYLAFWHLTDGIHHASDGCFCVFAWTSSCQNWPIVVPPPHQPTKPSLASVRATKLDCIRRVVHRRSATPFSASSCLKTRDWPSTFSVFLISDLMGFSIMEGLYNKMSVAFYLVYIWDCCLALHLCGLGTFLLLMWPLPVLSFQHGWLGSCCSYLSWQCSFNNCCCVYLCLLCGSASPATFQAYPHSQFGCSR